MPYENQRYNNNPRMGGSGGNYNRYNGQGQGQSRQQSAPRKNSDDITTNGVILHNEKVGRFLRTKFWNSCLGLEIGTVAPGMPLTFDTIRNAQVFGHVFSFSTIFELKEICDEVLNSLSETNTFESTATEAGAKKDAIVEISNGSNINMAPGIYLVIYKNVDAGKRTNTYEVYPFSSTRVLRGYDHNTGSAKEDIKANGNFKKFIKILEQAADAFTMAQAHAVAEVRKSDKLATFSALSAIAAGLGVDIMKTVNQANRVNGQSSYNREKTPPSQYQRRSQPGQWNQQNNGYQNNYQQQQQAMAAITDEPVDINLDAATLQNVNLNDFK